MIIRHVKTQLIRQRSTFSALLDASFKSGAVLKSLSTNIYENLALEDWIQEHVDLESRSLLLLWRNMPAAVIGRHQNPWQECHLGLMREKGIPLARRRSGGGAVYHDLGNINMTFFTSKKQYDRQRNMRTVTSALKDLRPGLDVRATERFDMLLNEQFKISGSAAKLGRTAAYHHCTLLCAADRSLLSGVLRSPCQGIKSNATPSVPSPVKNLTDEDPTLDCEIIMDAVANRYIRDSGLNGPLILIDPTDELCHPGIHRLTRELQTWNWVFGKTPKFTIDTCFDIPHEAVRPKVMLNMEVKYGIIEKCRIEVPSDWLPLHMCEEFSTLLVGSRFCPSDIAALFVAVSRANPQTCDLQAKLNLLCTKLTNVM
ncbi:lipoyltransferase 1, mitochondrial [Brienomyrus brachyistius]|uniref:lipoyltransferase 1, mitochondrial n=1 Tax=Brienomyrus brachyistius TaxID=42636 RepID=UPI0020B3DF5D|nr:lipoyltransferase 1, mitochondrial [Brienomyrus brachyistius]